MLSPSGILFGMPGATGSREYELRYQKTMSISSGRNPAYSIATVPGFRCQIEARTSVSDVGS